jgi:hypothetical protein
MSVWIAGRSRNPRRRGVHGVSLAAALIAALTLVPSQADAAVVPTPAWFATMTANPTHLPASPNRFLSYTLIAINEGGAATTGTVELEVILPEGVELVGAPEGTSGAQRTNPFPCSGAGRIVTCESAANPIGAGEVATLYVPATLAASAGAGPLTATGEVRGGGASASAASSTNDRTAAQPAFDFLPGTAGLYALATTPDGQGAAQSGSTPLQVEVGAGFPTVLERELESQNEAEFSAAGGGLKDLSATLPPGMVVNPEAAPTCTEAQLESIHEEAPGCPPDSQVGLLRAGIAFGYRGGGASSYPLFNMVAPGGNPAILGAGPIEGTYIHFVGAVNSAGRYELAASANNVLAKIPISGGRLTLWGVPSAGAHDGLRGVCLFEGPGSSCPSAVSPSAFIRMPSSCSSTLTTQITADGWVDPASGVSRQGQLTDSKGSPLATQGCASLLFAPSIAISPTSKAADSPTGLDVGIHVPQNPDPETPATSTLKDVTVSLPSGVAVNPSAANGLSACSETQVGFSAARAAEGETGFTDASASCPDASKLGTVEVRTPLLGHPLPGSVYLATPHENPFGTLLALYVVVDDPQSGVVLKLPGEIQTDPQTGQLTATFRNNPQLPFEDLNIQFFGGEGAALKTPPICGTYSAHSSLAPWSGNPASQLSTDMSFNQAPAGGVCATSSGAQPNNPAFEAGSKSASAGAFSPFSLKVARADGSQNLRRINAVLPPGLVAKLAGIPYCSDAAISAASGKSGTAEQAGPSCPASSEIGEAIVGAGAGPEPYYVHGGAYLAGPYKGAPLSLAFVTPAVAGPFDLGTVVVRAGLYVNPVTAQITAKSDELPTILQGIPLDIRSVDVRADRAGFTLNPTNCEPLATSAEAISVLGSVAPIAQRFQVSGCKQLKFAPNLSLHVIGKTNRNAKPRLKAVLTTKSGEANIKRAQINLPHSIFLEQSHIKTVCTRVQFAEGNGNGSACPKGSVYGRAVAWTPLLDHPLEGLVYLRSNGGERKLPDMVAALSGQIQIALQGKVDSGPNQGLRNTFEVVPDAPVSRFVLELNGKKKGLLVNSEDLCSKQGKSRRAVVRLTGQNGAVEQFKPKVAAGCGNQDKKGDGPK